MTGDRRLTTVNNGAGMNSMSPHSQYCNVVAKSISPGCPYLGTVKRSVFLVEVSKMFQNQLKREGWEDLVRGNAFGTRTSAEMDSKGK